MVANITLDDAHQLGGLTTGEAKRVIVVWNIDTTDTLTLLHEDEDSEAANRLNLGGSNFDLTAGYAAAFAYNTVSSRFDLAIVAKPFPLANDPGHQGDPGLDGTDPGYPFVFKSTVTEADPDLGNVQFNNTTLASVTKIIVSDFSSATDNPDVSAIVASWDNTGSSDRGRLLLKARAHPERTAEFKVTGAITDHDGDWAEIPVDFIGGIGLTADDAVSVQYYQPGPAGEVTGGVDSFNGRTGTVVPASSDYDASQISYDGSTSGSSETTVQGIIDENEGRIDSLEDDVAENTAALADKLEVGDLGSAAFESASSFATAAQGAKADSAVQPSAISYHLIAPIMCGRTVVTITMVCQTLQAVRF